MRSPFYKIVCAVSFLLAIWTTGLFAQNPQVQEKVAALKQSSAQNKQMLAQYTWQEQQTVSIKGEVKKQSLFQVQMGPNGKPQKTPIGAQPQQQSDSGGGRRGRLKEHVVEKKTEEFEDYAKQIAALIQSYTQLDPQNLEQARQAGNIKVAEAGPNQVNLTIGSYLKSNDSMVLTFDTAQKQVLSLQINSYLQDQSDAVNATVQFSRIPNGPNHASSILVNGVKKQLTVNIQNSNYQHL